MIIQSDGTISSWNKMDATFLQQAVKYGDLFFESMLVVDGNVSLLPYHQKRMNETSTFFDLDVKENFLQDVVIPMFRCWIPSGRYKVRLNYFRKGNAIYWSSDLKDDFFIEVSEIPITEVGVKKLGVFDALMLNQSNYSHFKTNNCLVYNFAKRKLKDSIFDDWLLVNQNEEVAESTYSNVFWIKKEQIFTTPLSSGCIQGVFRQFILDRMNVEIQSITVDEIREVDEIFLTNAVRGIMPACLKVGQSTEYTNKLIHQLKTSKL